MESTQLTLPMLDARGSLGESFAWLAKRLDCATWTRRMHADHARLLCLYFGAKLPIEAITYERLQGYVEAESLRVTRETIRKRLGTLRMALAEAERRGLISRIPPWPRIKCDTRPRKAFLTIGQWRVLRMACDDEPLRVFIDIGFWTGMHTSDLNRLRWRDVDFMAKTWIRRNTKSKADPQELPVPAELMAILEERAERTRPHRGDLICGHSLGHPVRAMAALCEKADVPRVSPIDLRRSCATWLCDRGATEDFARLWLGHSSTSNMLAKHYRQPSPEMLAKGRAAVGG